MQIGNTTYDLRYQDMSGPTASVRVVRDEETVYTGSIQRIFPPEREELKEVVWDVFDEILSDNIYRTLRESPESLKGVPGDEIIYRPQNEFNIPER